MFVAFDEVDAKAVEVNGTEGKAVHEFACDFSEGFVEGPPGRLGGFLLFVRCCLLLVGVLGRHVVWFRRGSVVVIIVVVGDGCGVVVVVVVVVVVFIVVVVGVVVVFWWPEYSTLHVGITTLPCVSCCDRIYVIDFCSTTDSVSAALTGTM